MGYDSYSRKHFQRESITNEKEILSHISQFGLEFVSGILTHSIIRQYTIEDFTGLDRDRVRAFISMLVRNRCLRPEQMWYRKTQPFIKLLKDIEAGKKKLETEEEF